MQNVNTDDIVTLLLLIIAIILTALLLYLSARLIAGKSDLDTGYFIRLVLVAILIWVAIIAVNAILGAIPLSGELGLTNAATVIIFSIAIYLVKMFVLPATNKADSFERSLWIALLTFIFIYIVNALSGQLGYPLISFFSAACSEG